MRRHLTFLLLAGLVAVSACRSKPKKKVAELPVEPPLVGHSGNVRLRSVESADEDPKKSQAGAKPKARVPETAPVVPVPKPPVKPVPPLIAKPASAPVPTPAPSPKPAVDANAGSAPASAPVTIPAVARPLQPAVLSPTLEAEKASRPPIVKAAPPSGERPAPVPSAAGKPNVAPPQSEKPNERVVERSVPTKPLAITPATEPLRTAIPAAAATQTKPVLVGPILGLLGTEPRPRVGDAGRLPLPTGGGGSTNAGSPAPPLALQFGSGTNQPLATNAALRAIGVDPLLQGTTWREQQLAKQAAEQKAREEEQRKLKGALYRFLFKGDTNR